MPNLDKRRTLMENVKRNASRGQAHVGDFRTEDMRFKTWETSVQYQSNAVVVAMMDVSGSMGEFEKYIARSFYFWMVRFLRTKYTNVEIVSFAPYRGARGYRRRVLPQGRVGRHAGFLGLYARARYNQDALPRSGLEHLPVPLLRRR